MSEPARLQQEPDRVPALRLVVLVACALCVSALGVLGSWWLLRRDLASQSATRASSPAAFAAGTPEQTPIETSERGVALKNAQRLQLSRYGWVDRRAGIAHIPIDRAIELRAKGVR